MTAFQRRRLAALAVALAGTLAASAGHAGGLDLHADSDAADVGLPAYPGAIKKSDRNGDPTGFSFGVWGESFGIKLAVVTYRSVDSVDKVASFYRDAMGRYGSVLDCSDVRNKPKTPHASHDDKADKDKPVTCDDDDFVAGGRLYKVGTNRAQRVFKATPWHDGVTFELVRVEQHGTD